MSDRELIEQVKKWGYYSLPRADPQCPGCSGLLVAIRAHPTGRHFDPQTLHLRLRDEHGLARWRTLSWTLPLEGPAHLCPGRVTLHGHLGREADFFTFGGSVEVAFQADEHVYHLHSPAPFLELSRYQETAANQLAAEAELLMAEIEARWGRDELGFLRRLAEVDPLQFYLAFLRSTLVRYEQADRLQKVYGAFYDVLLRERGWFIAQGLWPDALPTLEEILAPGQGVAQG